MEEWVIEIKEGILIKLTTTGSLFMIVLVSITVVSIYISNEIVRFWALHHGHPGEWSSFQSFPMKQKHDLPISSHNFTYQILKVSVFSHKKGNLDISISGEFTLVVSNKKVLNNIVPSVSGSELKTPLSLYPSLYPSAKKFENFYPSPSEFYKTLTSNKSPLAISVSLTFTL